MPRKVLIRKKNVIQKPFEDLKKHFTERLWSGIGRTNTTLLAWVTALFLILVSSLLPLSTKLKELNKLDKTKQRAVKKLDSIKETIKQEEDFPSLEAGKLTDKKDNALDLQKKIEGKNNEIDQLKKEISSISTPFGTLSVPIHYTPLIWIFLFAGLLWFFLYRRITLFFTIAKLIDLNITDSRKKIDEIKGLATGTPFWLAPLPYSIKKIDGSMISKESMKTFMGWETGERLKTIATVSFIFIGFSISFWVLIIALHIGRVIYGTDLHSKLEMQIPVMAILIVSIISCIYLLRPRIDLKEFSSRVKGDANGRRHFLKTAGTVAVIGFIYTIVPSRVFANRIKRYKLKEKTNRLSEQFRNNFWVNKKAEKFTSEKSLVIHYVGANGLTNGNIYLEPKNLAPKNKEEIIDLESTKPQSKAINTKLKEPHLNPSQYSAIIECLTLEQLNLNRIDSAIDILWNGIIQDIKMKKRNGKTPSYRLYDLLAGIAYKYMKQDYQAKLNELIQSEWSQDNILNKRKESWSKPSERWLSKWNPQQPLNWKHPFKNWKIPSQESKSIYLGYLE